MMKLRDAIVMLTLTGSAPALADWQYTKWGMTPAELKLSAQGRAIDYNDPRLDTSIETLKMGAIYKTPTIEYIVAFYFDNRTDRLTKVDLHPRPASDCKRMFSDLRSTYGEPLPRKGNAIYVLQQWEDVSAGNHLDALMIGSSEAPSDCSVTYRPLRAKTGL